MEGDKDEMRLNNKDGKAAGKDGDQVTGKKTSNFPSCLRDHLERADEGSQEMYDAFPDLQPGNIKKQIFLLTKELHRARGARVAIAEKRLADKIWMLANHKFLAHKEWMLQHPFSIHSLKYFKKNNEWIGKVWISDSHTIEEPLEDDAVTRLIGPHLYYAGRFRRNGFSELRAYDRLCTVQEVHFRDLRQLDSDSFELADIQGQKVVVTCKFLLNCPNVTRYNILEARNNYNRGSTKYTRLTPGSVVQKDIQERAPKVAPKDNGLPKIFFQNSEKDKDGALCLPYSLANALLHLGRLSEAMKISASRVRDLGELGAILTLQDGVKIPSRRVFVNNERYNPLFVHHRIENPIVAVIRAYIIDEDGKERDISVNHSLCFLGDLFFDVNQDNAQKISVKALNKVTDMIVTNSKFGGILQAREFLLKERMDGHESIAKRKLRNKKRKKNKKKRAKIVE